MHNNGINVSSSAHGNLEVVVYAAVTIAYSDLSKKMFIKAGTGDTYTGDGSASMPENVTLLSSPKET